MMWHEARKREKATQKLFNDQRKRAEKRREENRVDPSSFLQVNGVKAKLCLDPNVYKQAAASMVAWQGDSKLMIDRFDVRATLESLPKDDTGRPKDKASRDAGVLDMDEAKPMKTLLDYERYRLLMQNDLHVGSSEQSRLNLVAKSDIISDAKLRKLKGNKFGTSGETSALEQTVHSKPLVRELTKRANITGPTYNAVPPPSSLASSKSSAQSRSSWSCEQRSESNETISRLANEVIDLDDYDDFDPDQVDIRENNKHTIDVAKKYGLSSEELILLSKLDNKEASIKESLGELKILAKRKLQISKDKMDSSQQVYGPALPPGAATNEDHVSDPSTSDDDGSRSDTPMPQRSPTGINMLPLRNRSRVSDNYSGDEQKQTTELSEPLRTAVEEVEPETVLKPPTKERSPTNALDQSKAIELEEPPPKLRRRASTPLAYKRNCRSSRSLSRERRLAESKTKDHNRKRNSSFTSSSSGSLSPARRQQYRSHSRRHYRDDRSRKRLRDR